MYLAWYRIKNMRSSLAESVFVLTGVAGGLGESLALALGARGATIIGVDSNKEALPRVSTALSSQKIKHQLSALDITDKRAVEKFCKPFQEKRIDGLILNAGITRIFFFDELSDAEFEKVFAVNFFAAVSLCRHLLKPLRRSSGVLVGISSVSGFAPLMKRTAYSASKHALAGFLETLRSEETAIDVLVVYPSFIETQLRQNSEAGTAAAGKPKGISAEAAAQKICTAVVDRKKRLYLPFLAKLSRWVWFLWPDFYIRRMKKRA